ncbi:MAG: AAA domain-containing protein [Promethearchaeota archaeon]
MVKIKNMTSKVYNIFEYLQAVKNLTYPPIRDVSQYEQIWCQADLPINDGIRFFNECYNPEAWLEVDKVSVPEPPKYPKNLEKWIDADINNPVDEIKYKSEISILNENEKEELENILEDIQELERNKNEPNKENVFTDINQRINELETRWQYLEANNHIRFEDDPKRLENWDKYIKVWQQWRFEVLPKFKVQEFYGELFSVYQKLQREGDLLELVFGHGFITWSINSVKIRHPLITTRLELIFDYNHSRFYLIPTDSGSEFETNFLWDINLPNISHLNKIKDQYNQSEQIPFESNLIKPFFKDVVNIIDPNSKFKYDKQINTQATTCETYPIIYDVPVLILRKRATNLWQNELQKIKELLKNDFRIPLPLESLSTDTVIEEKDVEQINKWQTLSEKILFPLTSNSEQREIIRKLSKNYGVAVQGPPGTGKSHTIVNIISHLLAYGNRVLVTAETSRALKVLGEMINKNLKDIAPLCISLLDKTEQDRNELERSITGIHEGIANKKGEDLQKNIVYLENEIEKCDDEYFKIKVNIKQNIDSEATRLNNDYDISHVAQNLEKEEENYGWLPDSIPFESGYIPKENEIKKLFELTNLISNEDIEQIKKIRPSLDELPNIKEIQSKFKRLKELLINRKSRQEKLHDWDFNNISSHKLRNSIVKIDHAIKSFEIISQVWESNLFNKVVTNQNELNQWAQFYRTVRKNLDAINKNEKILIKYKIQHSNSISTREVVNNLEIILREFEHHNKLRALFLIAQKKMIDTVINNFKINDEKPRMKYKKDYKILKIYLENIILKNELKNTWNNTIQNIQGPVIKSIDKNDFNKLIEILSVIKTILNWRQKYLSPIITLLNEVEYLKLDWSNKQFLIELKYVIECHLLELEIDYTVNELNINRKFLKEKSCNDNYHSSWNRLEQSIVKLDIDEYEACISELVHLQSIQEQYDLLTDLYKKIGELAPNWINSILDKKQSTGKVEYPTSWKKAWEWSILNDWYHKHARYDDIEKSYNRLEKIKKRKSKLTEQLIAEKAWLNLLRNIGPVEKGALYPFLKAVQRITKSGRGKYDPIVRREASNAMKKCAPAVPVWIMPIRKVLETLSPDSKQFDVVIIDESSQCDLFSLSVLFRGKRVLIVGDDKQVSPQKPGINIQQAYVNLKEKFLSDLPNVNLATWGPDVSLFDKAQEIFLKINSTVMLKEHFRSVPEIIQWSNDRFYNGKIEPLRYPKLSERIEPPLKPVFVAEGRWKEETRAIINRPEAKSIVLKIKDLVHDSNYRNKSMGVISLQGGMDQAFEIEKLMRQEIDDSEIQERNIICGDSKHFQGDERDIMFLSMVAAPNERFQALTKKDAQQRFNVAATRARDQIWLFHSVQFDNLSPSDLRYALLEYFYNPKRVQIEMDKADEIFQLYNSSEFHKEVFKAIVAKGYRAIPEYKVGNHPYRIDIVIEGMKNRLAVECDGDSFHGSEQWEYDYNRQMELERAGFIFWRIRASKYYRNKEKSLNPLWLTLDDMGIYPFEKGQNSDASADSAPREDIKKDNA